MQVHASVSRSLALTGFQRVSFFSLVFTFFPQVLSL